MAELQWRELFAVLQEQLDRLYDLYELSVAEARCLAQGNAAALATVTQQASAVASQVAALEETRFALQQRLANDQGMSEAAGLADVLCQAPSHLRSDGEALCNSLRLAVADLQAVKSTNTELIEQGLAFAQWMMRVMTARPGAGACYQPPGFPSGSARAATGPVDARILDNRA